MLENLELMKNGLMDPYGKVGPSDPKARKMEPSQPQNRVKPSMPSLPSSSSPAATSTFLFLKATVTPSPLSSPGQPAIPPLHLLLPPQAHMCGMQDPYMMKTLMSNPVPSKAHGVPEANHGPSDAAASWKCLKPPPLQKSKNNKDQRAAMNAQSLLWQSWAASVLQHQQMQQLQQLQLHP
ncbi:hypothetical protein Btru_025367 [Bulinus truncatus]|nr:hypothetical protein Btru_025367 [Bulinus truncatus]